MDPPALAQGPEAPVPAPEYNLAQVPAPLEDVVDLALIVIFLGEGCVLSFSFAHAFHVFFETVDLFLPLFFVKGL